MNNENDQFAPYSAPKAEPYLIPIVFGDWSNDGHGESIREYVWSNKGIRAWRDAFVKGCEAVGVDLAEDVASDYECSRIEGADLAKLRASGFARELGNEPEVDGSTEIDPDEFREMFFHLVTKGDPEITCVILGHSPHHMEVHPGGYGLLGDR